MNNKKESIVRRIRAAAFITAAALYLSTTSNLHAETVPQSTSHEPPTISSNPFRYSGYYQDDETGMYYLKARYYDPATMRFITMDTYDLPNRYNYCDGDPVHNTDPEGHRKEYIEQQRLRILKLLTVEETWGLDEIYREFHDCRRREEHKIHYLKHDVDKNLVRQLQYESLEKDFMNAYWDAQRRIGYQVKKDNDGMWAKYVKHKKTSKYEGKQSCHHISLRALAKQRHFDENKVDQIFKDYGCDELKEITDDDIPLKSAGFGDPIEMIQAVGEGELKEIKKPKGTTVNEYYNYSEEYCYRGCWITLTDHVQYFNLVTKKTPVWSHEKGKINYYYMRNEEMLQLIGDRTDIESVLNL